MKKIIPFLLALFFLNSFAIAQNDKAPPCTTDPAYNQFDFWVGDWDVYAKGKVVGTNKVEKILDNGVVMENWVGGTGSNGKSFNSYNAETKRWTQTWVDNGGNTFVFEGGWIDGAMKMKGDFVKGGTTTLFSLEFHPNAENQTVKQIWKASKDNGETWNLLFEGLYVEKITKARK